MNEEPTDRTEPGTAQTTAETAEAEGSAGRLKQLGAVNIVRIVVGGFGLAGFVLGAIVAWHSASATTLLIVSAVLLVLAALGLDWNKIRGTYGGWTLELLRDFGARIEEVATSAATEEVPQAIREELESLRSEMKALTPPPGRPRRSPLTQTAPLNVDAIREFLKTKATHSFRGTDAVQLSLRLTAPQDARYRCTVTTPSGGSCATVAAQNKTGIMLPTIYSVVYPDDFEGSEPLVPGRYEVAWRSAPLMDPVGPNPLFATLAQTLGTPVATDAFSIPGAVAAPTTSEDHEE